jgi:diacylglycerol O-acyltransferase
MLKQLSQQDVGFLYLETSETPAHVGGVDLVELPDGYRGNYFDDYKAMVASRVHLIPFMRQKLVQLPLELDRPFWADDEHFDLDYHVIHEALPSPGGMAELEELIGRLHALPLDRGRPLWEFHVIEGLASGQIALYLKIHHAAMDGASSLALIHTFYDPSPAPRAMPREQPRPVARASVRQLAKGVLAHLLRQGIRTIQAVPELARLWTRLVLPDPETLRYHWPARRPHTPRTLFNVGITAQRLYAARSLSLPAIRQLGKHTGTTINDVMLAVCSGALRGYLADREALPDASMTAMVPIDVRAGSRPATANQNSAYVCSLASDVDDPYERLLAIHRSSADQRKWVDLFGQLALPDLSILGGSVITRPLIELFGRSGLADHAPLFGNLTISNVRGPDTTLYVAGARLVSLYPCSIPFHALALNITAQSYGDRLDIGLVACRRAVPDLAELADRLEPALAELEQAVTRRLGKPAVTSEPPTAKLSQTPNLPRSARDQKRTTKITPTASN